MYYLPKLKKLSSQAEFNFFAETYEKNSGLSVPTDYLEQNHVFGICFRKKMIGGFILGSGPALRTVQFFAAPQNRPGLYQQMEAPDSYTEICCFWIARAYRQKTSINYFIWLSMALSLKRYGTKNIIFGTQSPRLAALYSATSKSRFLHSDRVNKRPTFIYVARKKGCASGIIEIVWYKFKRLLKIVQKRQVAKHLKSA